MSSYSSHAQTRIAVVVSVTLCAAAVVAVISKRKRAQKHKKEAPVRVGLLGTGWAINVQLPKFREAGLEIVALYSRDQKKADELARKHNIKHAFSSYEELCKCPEVDIVSVVTPPYLHAKMTRTAIEAGKHVLCDKPTAMNANEAQSMLDVALKSNQFCLIDHELRFTPGLQKARQLVQQGVVGPLVFVSVSFIVGREARKRWDWWCDETQGGGLLGALGSHIFDSIRFIVGKEFKAVSSNLRSVYDKLEDDQGQMRDVTSDFYFQCSGRLEDQTSVHVLCASAIFGHVASSLLVISGKTGTIAYDWRTGELTAWDTQRKTLAHVKSGGENPFPAGTYLLGVALQSALGPRQERSKLDLAGTMRDALATQKLLDACRASSKENGKWVDV